MTVMTVDDGRSLRTVMAYGLERIGFNVDG